MNVAGTNLSHFFVQMSHKKISLYMKIGKNL